MNVAFYGGSFNPPHVAHVLTAAYVLSCFDVDQVVVAPVFEHAFDKALAPFDQRVALCELALAWLPGVQVSRIEETLDRPNFTLHTLQKLAAERPGDRLFLVVGSDVLFERPKWHAFDEVVALAPPIVLGRVGHEHPEAPVPILPEVSSTRIRELLARPTTDSVERELAALVPRAVLAHVRKHGLYR